MKKLIIALSIILISGIAIAADVYEKVDDNTLKVETAINETKEVTYKYEYLLSQKAQIEKDLVRVQAELAQINKLIAEADKLGIDVKAVEVVEPIEEDIK